MRLLKFIPILFGLTGIAFAGFPDGPYVTAIHVVDSVLVAGTHDFVGDQISSNSIGVGYAPTGGYSVYISNAQTYGVWSDANNNEFTQGLTAGKQVTIAQSDVSAYALLDIVNSGAGGHDYQFGTGGAGVGPPNAKGFFLYDNTANHYVWLADSLGNLFIYENMRVESNLAVDSTSTFGGGSTVLSTDGSALWANGAAYTHANGTYGGDSAQFQYGTFAHNVLINTLGLGDALSQISTARVLLNMQNPGGSELWFSDGFGGTGNNQTVIDAQLVGSGNAPANFLKFRVSDGNAVGHNLVLTLTGDELVGIRDSTPSFPLDVGGSIRDQGDMYIYGDDTITGQTRMSDCYVYGDSCAGKTYVLEHSGSGMTPAAFSDSMQWFQTTPRFPLITMDTGEGGSAPRPIVWGNESIPDSLYQLNNIEVPPVLYTNGGFRSGSDIVSLNGTFQGGGFYTNDGQINIGYATGAMEADIIVAASRMEIDDSLDFENTAGTGTGTGAVTGGPFSGISVTPIWIPVYYNGGRYALPIYGPY